MSQALTTSHSLPVCRRQIHGFTLLELLVAIFVSAVMFSLGYAALNQAASQQSRLQDAQQSLADLQRTIRLLTQDFSQLSPRPVRDELGRSLEPALRLDPRQSELISFTRGGQSLTMGDPRSRLLRVRYLLEGEQLVRLSTSVLDRAAASPPWRRQELLGNVLQLEIRALDASGEWRQEWPLPEITGASGISSAGLRGRPRAIELRLQTRDRGEIRRVIEVTG